MTRSAKQTPASDEPPVRDDAAPAFGEDAETDRRKSASAILDAEVLDELETRGLSFSERMGAGDDSLADLAKKTPYGPIAEVLAADLAELDAGDPRAGVGMRFAHRLFDPAYLTSPRARFELIGALSRLDRRPFTPGACGELRLVYRLAYTADAGGRSLFSRLPMTLTLDYLDDPPGEGGCVEAARRWRIPEAGGPPAALDRERLDAARLHRVQVNLQSVRWPSAVHPSLGGHAEYILRAFSFDRDGELAAEPLENTPDVEALRRDAEARADLLAWIRDPGTLRRIDEGTAVMPARFAAERAVSAAPHGLARVANRPFFQLFDEDDVAGIDFEGLDLERVRSPAGLLRRLDDHSCAGCHQGRAVAGFHLLGEDRPGAAAGNAVASALSPHARDELGRRRDLLAAEAAGRDDASYARPFSERDRGAKGAYGTPCGLTADETFAAWDCAEGLRCRPYGSSPAAPHVGVCLPEAPEVGDPCEVGELRARAEPRADRIHSTEGWPCGHGQVCNRSRVGFPGGMCTASCADPGDAGRCGAIAVLEPFNACIARGQAFDECLRDHVRPAALRACDADTSCRNDYLCARNADGDGVCIPPYFLFQMRVDGHP